jgi:hypothetical protein
MKQRYNYMEKAGNHTWAVWIISLLPAVAGCRFVKEAIVFLLMKLYEIFIQRNALN